MNWADLVQSLCNVHLQEEELMNQILATSFLIASQTLRRLKYVLHDALLIGGEYKIMKSNILHFWRTKITGVGGGVCAR